MVAVSKHQNKDRIRITILTEELPEEMPTTTDGIEDCPQGAQLLPGSVMITGDGAKYLYFGEGSWHEMGSSGGGGGGGDERDFTFPFGTLLINDNCPGEAEIDPLRGDWSEFSSDVISGENIKYWEQDSGFEPEDSQVVNFPQGFVMLTNGNLEPYRLSGEWEYLGVHVTTDDVWVELYAKVDEGGENCNSFTCPVGTVFVTLDDSTNPGDWFNGYWEEWNTYEIDVDDEPMSLTFWIMLG